MKNELKRLISQGKTKQVLEKLLSDPANLGDLRNEVILQSSRFETYREARRSGTSSFEEKGISLAQINQAILEIIDKLPEEQSQNNVLKTTQNKWFAGVLFLIILLSGVFMFSGDRFKNSSSSNPNTDVSFSQTVYVHGKKGKKDLILSQEGEVVLMMGNAHQIEAINAKGEATFKELPIGFLNKSVEISIKHEQDYQVVKEDTSYLLNKKAPIYLEVELKNMDLVSGKIIDFVTEEPIDSVRVSYRDNECFSDQHGRFVLKIQEKDRKKSISLSFAKAGYKTKNLSEIYPHLNPEQETEISLKRK